MCIRSMHRNYIIIPNLESRPRGSGQDGAAVEIWVRRSGSEAFGRGRKMTVPMARRPPEPGGTGQAAFSASRPPGQRERFRGRKPDFNSFIRFYYTCYLGECQINPPIFSGFFWIISLNFPISFQDIPNARQSLCPMGRSGSGGGFFPLPRRKTVGFSGLPLSSNAENRGLLRPRFFCFRRFFSAGYSLLSADFPNALPAGFFAAVGTAKALRAFFRIGLPAVLPRFPDLYSGFYPFHSSGFSDLPTARFPTEFLPGTAVVAAEILGHLFDRAGVGHGRHTGDLFKLLGEAGQRAV